MTGEDLALECVECAERFIFSAGEQAYFASKALATPKRCARCRKVKSAQMALTRARGAQGSSPHLRDLEVRG